MKITNTILKQGEFDGVDIFYTEMSKIDKFSYQPTEDDEGRLYFIIDIKGTDVNFYQSGEFTNAFNEEWSTQAFIFTPEDEDYKNNELHIINDYE